MTLRTRLETKIGSDSTLGPKGFDCDIVFTLEQTLGGDTHKDIVAKLWLSSNSLLYQEVTKCCFRMARGQYFILGFSLALIVLSAHISEGRTHSDIASDEYKQLSTTSLQPVSREKRGNSFIQKKKDLSSPLSNQPSTPDFVSVLVS